MKLARLSAVLLFVLGGCGGDSTAPPIHVMPSSPPTSSPSNRATATVSFKVPLPPPGSAAAASGLRPEYLSPGSNFMNIFIDGVSAFKSVPIYTYTPAGYTQTFTSTDGKTVIVLTGVISGAYFVWTMNVDTLPGKLTFGITITGNIPPIVLSETQATYALSPGPNTPQALTLSPVMGSSYIQCDTKANVALNNACAGSFNTSTGLYTLTAVAADYEGFPIIDQGTPFDNGQFTVVETTTPAILTLTNAGPYTSPGAKLQGPSGSWYVDGTFAYGQWFNVKCNATGSATLGLYMTNPTGVANPSGPTNPVTGFNYIYFPPNAEGTSNYPGGGRIVPVGSKTSIPGHPTSPNVMTNLATVNCDSHLNLTLN